MELQSGEVFANRFEIERAAGAGGMGTVYRARDQHSGAIIALKLVHGHGADRSPGDAERFCRESRILAELRHPGIVAYIADGESASGQRFLAMEWLEGEDLAQRLLRGPLPLKDALALLQRVAETLAFAHQRGVLHRDLKPTNLFLEGGDPRRVKILDFGIARRLAASRALTRTGMVLGTPEYMAPEQTRGASELTPAADIFSLGCILYECLTGEPPFIAEHIAAVLMRILFEEPTPVGQRRPGIPSAISTLLSAMLAKVPAQRIGDAATLVAAVAALGEVPELPMPPPASAPARAPAAFIGHEQVLLSVVLAVAPHNLPATDSTVPSAEVWAELEQHRKLLLELRRYGVEADLLISGALVITVPQMASARDQAALAARCAAIVKEAWPQAHVAVVTGRGSWSRGVLTGEALDRAWRLLGQAGAQTPPAGASEPSEILVDGTSARLLDTRFELHPSTSEGYALGSERLDEDTARPLLGKPTAYVGRERELSRLQATLAECCDEPVARAVLVLAPPGLGKSRLRHEFLRRLQATEPAPLILLGRGDPLKAKSSYGLLAAALRSAGDLRADQTPAEQQARLRTWTRGLVAAALPKQNEPNEQALEFLGELCGLPFSDVDSPRLRAARQDPRIMGDQVESAWVEWLRAVTQTRPVLLVLEDLQWADASTLKLVQAALRGLPDHPLMVLGLARPELLEVYPNLWGSTAHPLYLHPLSRKASEQLVRQVLGPGPSADEVLRIIERSAGNPLFLGELIRAAVEGKASEVPHSVAAMIQARIGRLPASLRRTLRAASVFGELFWEDGVRSLLSATHGADTVARDLQSLAREEVLEYREHREHRRERGVATEPEYRFRHALLRDAAYGLVSEEELAPWHTAAAGFLESMGESDPLVIAEHYRLSQQLARAAGYYARAAEQALDAGYFDAALLAIERGLACGAQGVVRGTLLSLASRIRFWRPG